MTRMSASYTRARTQLRQATPDTKKDTGEKTGSVTARTSHSSSSSRSFGMQSASSSGTSGSAALRVRRELRAVKTRNSGEKNGCVLAYLRVARFTRKGERNEQRHYRFAKNAMVLRATYERFR